MMGQGELQKLKELIELYGLITLEKLFFAIRPLIPWIVDHQDFIPIALTIAGTLVPVAIGSTIITAKALGRLSLFGVGVGVQTAKMAYGATKTTVQVATDVLIRKPIYLLSYPFRKTANDKEVMEMVEMCRFQQSELNKCRKIYSQSAKQPEKLLLVIKELGREQRVGEEPRVMIGSLDRKDRV